MDERESTAYGEAGRAVACYVLHRPLKWATIIPDAAAEDDQGYFAWHAPVPRWAFDPFVNVDALSWDHALMALAGPAAHCRHEHQEEGDWRRRLDDYLALHPAAEDQATNYLRLHSMERQLLEFEGVPASLFSLCLQTAAALVDEYGDLVDAVAQALLQRDTLGAAEIWALAKEHCEREASPRPYH